MIYSIDINVLQTYSITNKQRTIVSLNKGVIHQLDIQFPSGLAGTTHVQIADSLSQIWPTNPQQNFFADGYTISFRTDYELKYLPFQLYIFTWNDSVDHDHGVSVRFGLLPATAFIHRLIPEAMKLLMGVKE